MDLFKVYVNVNGKVTTLYTEPKEHWFQLVKEVYLRTGSQLISSVKLVRR